jgi:flavodoxin I
MRAIIVYDTQYGNTEMIAKAIGDAIEGGVSVLRAGGFSPSELERPGLLIVGSPTHGGRPTPATQSFIKDAPIALLEGTEVAAFDTRGASMFVRIFGYAATRIADSLKKRGGKLVAPPEGFIVEGTKGPLRDGETERAAAWAKEILKGE